MHIGLLEIKNAEAHIQKPNSKVIFECFFFNYHFIGVCNIEGLNINPTS